MSIYDKSSLVLIPSGTKTSKVYSQKPTNGDGDFDFTRSTAATRVNADGNIEKETSNLLLQSNSFDTTWTLTTAAVTSGQNGYDGSSDAWLLTKSGTQGRVQQTISASGVQSFSVYAKKNASDFLRVFVNGSNSSIYFDLTDGSIQSSSSIIEAKTTNLGGGWYRCEVSFNGSTTKINVYPSESGSTAGTTGSIYIQDAQLNQGLIAQEVITTTTTALYGGITDNVPRLDYTDSSCPALKLEPQRTNIIINSEYLGGSDWIKSGNGTGSVPVITSNAAISPEGVQNATRVDLDINGGTTSGDWSWVYQEFTGTGNDETFSMYIKAVDASNVGKVISFGSISFQNQSLTEDWVRIDSTSSAAIGGYGNGFRLRATAATSDTASFYVFGIQHEQNASYATSYIPTYGTSVTRNADIFKVNNIGTNNLITNDAFTLFIDIASVQDSENSFRDLVAIFGSKNFRLETRTSGQVRSQQIGMVTSGDNFNSVTIGTYNIRKFAFTFTTTQCKMYVDGALHSTYNGVYTHDFNVLSVRNSSSLGAELKIEYRKVMLFPTALTEQEAITLTTI